MIYLDFEYRGKNHVKDNELVCVVVCYNYNFLFFKLDNQEGRDKFAAFLSDKHLETFICFNATAEVCSLMQFNFIPSQLIDCWVEAKMYMLSHPKYMSKETNLLACCEKFGVTHDFADKKDESRDIILNNTSYSDEQWETIEAYCRADVKATVDLFEAIACKWPFHGITRDHAVNRGRFCIASAVAHYNTRGFPIDTEFLSLIENNSIEACKEVAANCNSELGVDVYKQKKDGTYSFNQANFEVLLKKLNLFDTWKKTASDKASKAEVDILWAIENFVSDNKVSLELLHESMQTIKTLSKKKEKFLSLRLTDDGYVNPPPFPFHQKTGRSSPKPSLGFMLNLQPWLRALIQPKPGYALIGMDWSKQEMIIAGALSGDQAFLDDVNGDVYIETAKLLGPKYVPADATKHSHPEIRQKFKAITLGIGYGKQERSLSIDMMNAFKCDADEGMKLATQLMTAHKNKYSKYWKWVETVLNDSLPQTSNKMGKYVTADNWYYFVDQFVRATQLQNVPMQSTGAAIMREGFINCVDAGLDVVCSLHDALYVTCKMEDIEATEAMMRDCMARGVSAMLPGQTMGNEAKITKSGVHYIDVRGVKMLTSLAKRCPIFSEKINSILAEK